ncbi:MAG: DNA cytosine methyltransferase, partial [Clostridia bacterium]|nr:DNA cytosine methyltransferase [Clostridia bacterium]
MEKTVCELFAGVGGFRLGLEKASTDWNTVWFSQWEPTRKEQWAHKCYVSHWGDIDEYTGIDIAKVDKKLIPDHNLLVGGFPCQDYSVARPLPGSTGITGKKGVLWWQIRDTLQEKTPPFVLLENVDRLLKSPASQRGRDFGVMLACFASLDYSVEWRVINAAEYGAAQRRRRIFIFAYKNDTKFYSLQSSKSTDSIIFSDGFFASTFPVNTKGVINSTMIKYSDVHSISENFAFPFENSGYMTCGKIYTVKTAPIIEEATPLRQLLEKNVAKKYYLGSNVQKWEYLKGA